VHLGKIAEDERSLFDKRELRDLLDKWLADHPSGKTTRNEFAAAVEKFNIDGYVVDGIVASLDVEGDDCIDFQDAIFCLSTFLRGSATDRLMAIFSVLDRNQDGRVSKQELMQAFSTQRRVVSIRSNQLNKIVTDVFEKADTDRSGSMTFEEFKEVVNQQSEFEQHLNAANAASQFNDSNTGWNARYESVRCLAKFLQLDVGTQKGNGDLNELSGPVVADVLDMSFGLSPIAIGEFLAHQDPKNREFASCFFASMDFAGMTLDCALRQASIRICFPGEAQKVDRLISAFARAYSESNPGISMDEDTVAITSYAILMLNSDLHNDGVRKKMSCLEFISNTQKVVPNMEQQQLEGIYRRVQEEEIRLDFANAIMSGSYTSNLEADRVQTNNISTTLGQLINDELGTVLRALRASRPDTPGSPPTPDQRTTSFVHI